MDAKPLHVRIYEAIDGRRPFEKWLRKLRDAGARQRIRVRIARLRLGNFGDAKSVGEGVSELRIDCGPGYRVYFGRDGEKVVILLCGGDKASQSADIQTAKVFWADYKAREREQSDGTV